MLKVAAEKWKMKFNIYWAIPHYLQVFLICECCSVPAQWRVMKKTDRMGVLLHWSSPGILFREMWGLWKSCHCFPLAICGCNIHNSTYLLIQLQWFCWEVWQTPSPQKNIMNGNRNFFFLNYLLSFNTLS